MVSIFGFGYDDDYKWTFAGRRPLPREDPENVEVEEKLKEPKNEDAKENDPSEWINTNETIAMKNSSILSKTIWQRSDFVLKV